MISDHVDEERIQRLLDGELPRALREATREHVDGCERCRRRTESARAENAGVDALLRELDHPPPPVAAGRVIHRATVRPIRWRRFAAGVVLVLALSGTAYAASAGPDSVLGRVVTAMVGWVRGRSAPDQGVSTLPPAAAVQNAGIAVAPGSRLEIVVEAQQGGMVEVSLTDGPDVTLQAPADAAAFTSDEGRVEISSSRTTTFQVRIPRSVRSLVIVANGQPLYEQQSRRITAVVSPDADGTYRIPVPVSQTRN